MDPPGGVVEEETVTERRTELASRGARLLEERIARGAVAAAAAAAAAEAKNGADAAAAEPA
jgi:sRNA-binding protein